MSSKADTRRFESVPAEVAAAVEAAAVYTAGAAVDTAAVVYVAVTFEF